MLLLCCYDTTEVTIQAITGLREVGSRWDDFLFTVLYASNAFSTRIVIVVVVARADVSPLGLSAKSAPKESSLGNLNESTPSSQSNQSYL